MYIAPAFQRQEDFFLAFAPVEGAGVIEVWHILDADTAAAEDEPHVPERAVNGITGWIDCYGKASLAGSVFAGGVTDAGSIDGHAALQKAYEMGKNA